MIRLHEFEQPIEDLPWDIQSNFNLVHVREDGEAEKLIQGIPPVLEKVFDDLNVTEKITPEVVNRAQKAASILTYHIDWVLKNRYGKDVTQTADIFAHDIPLIDLSEYYREGPQKDLHRENVTEHTAEEHLTEVRKIGSELFTKLSPAKPHLAGAKKDKVFREIYDETGILPVDILASDLRDIGIFRAFDFAVKFHDIGNIGGKGQHTEAGAIAAYHILNKLGYPQDFINLVVLAIAMHTKSPSTVLLDAEGQLKKNRLVLQENSFLGNKDDDITPILFDVASILYLADKLDIRSSRLKGDQVQEYITHMAEPDPPIAIKHFAQAIADGSPKITIHGEHGVTVQYPMDPEWIIFNASKDVATLMSIHISDPHLRRVGNTIITHNKELHLLKNRIFANFKKAITPRLFEIPTDGEEAVLLGNIERELETSFKDGSLSMQQIREIFERLRQNAFGRLYIGRAANVFLRELAKWAEREQTFFQEIDDEKKKIEKEKPEAATRSDIEKRIVDMSNIVHNNPNYYDRADKKLAQAYYLLAGRRTNIQISHINECYRTQFGSCVDLLTKLISKPGSRFHRPIILSIETDLYSELPEQNTADRMEKQAVIYTSTNGNSNGTVHK